MIQEIHSHQKQQLFEEGVAERNSQKSKIRTTPINESINPPYATIDVTRNIENINFMLIIIESGDEKINLIILVVLSKDI